jgi:hypothetical protein
MTEERCEHDMLRGQCATCASATPGSTNRVYRTAGGQAFHRRQTCEWLHKGQHQAERRDQQVHPVQVTDVVDARAAGLAPCRYCFSDQDRRPSPLANRD